MIGLKSGTVALLPHQEEWRASAETVIAELRQVLGGAALDVQHVGSTAIPLIHAKPIIDIAVAMKDVKEIVPYEEELKRRGITFRGEMVAGEAFYVMESQGLRTHHIHVVKWKGSQWENYLNFRDYLNACPEKARQYDARKQELAARFSQDRKSYTAGKEKLIQRLLAEAAQWRASGGAEQ